MKFSSAPNLDKRTATDLLILPYWKGKLRAEQACEFGKIGKSVTSPIESKDFKGKEGELLILYVSGQKEKRIALLGLGDQEKITTEILRRAYSSVAKACISKGFAEVNLLKPEISSLSYEQLVTGVIEGLLLANYVFDKLKNESLKEKPTTLMRQAHLIGFSKNEHEFAQKLTKICEGTYLARDLINGNADDVTPQYLAQVAQSFSKKFPHVKTTVFDKKRIEKEKMGLLLAVNSGSARDPVFVIINYKGDPKSKSHTIIVGKGITYDTGGLNIKTSGMETMKCDMGGAAAGLGIILAAANIGLKANFSVVFAATENCIGSKSYKVGDVYKSYAGKTVEIGNTDAEGRLILADTLAYVKDHLKPTCIIDFATLTGAIEIALGSEATGLFSNNDALADALIRSGSETFERLWRLPLYEEYKERLKSDIADLKNIGGRPAGAIVAAAFLREFVGDIPWAHCDIAATAFLPEIKRYQPKYATGVGVRLIINFLEHLI
jgi:leucyl aminopeptidase